LLSWLGLLAAAAALLFPAARDSPALWYAGAVCAALFGLSLLPAGWRGPARARVGRPPVLLTLLALAGALLAAMELPAWPPWGPASYPYALRFGLGVVLAALLVQLLPVPSWRRGVTEYLLRPAAVFLLGIAVALVIVQAPKRAFFQSSTVSEGVTLGLAGPAPLTVTCPRLNLLVVPNDGASVVLQGVVPGGDLPPPPGMKKGTYYSRVEFTPPDGQGVTPYYELRALPPPGPQGPAAPAQVRLEADAAPEADDWLGLEQQRGRSDAPLVIEWRARRAVTVAGVRAFTLTMRNCKYTAAAPGGTVSGKVGDEVQILSGLLRLTAPIRFTCREAERKRLELYLLTAPGADLAGAEVDGPLTRVEIQGLRSGKLITMTTLLGATTKETAEWKEKEDIVPRKLVIRAAEAPGDKELRPSVQLELRPDGLHAGAQGMASSAAAEFIQGHPSEQLSDWLSLLLKMNAFVALAAVIAWSVDKIFSYLSLRQSHAPPPAAPGPGPTVTGS
jgi:hypothetical protein